MLELLQERVSLFCELAEVTSGQDLYPPVTRYMFRADTPQAPRAEKNLQDATAEGDSPNPQHEYLETNIFPTKSSRSKIIKTLAVDQRRANGWLAELELNRR